MARRGVIAGFMAGIVVLGLAIAAIPAAVSFAETASEIHPDQTSRVVRLSAPTTRSSPSPSPTPMRAATRLHGWPAAPRTVLAGHVLRAPVRASGGMRVVRLERRIGSRWRLVDRVRTGSDGRAALAWRAPKHAGRAVLRVHVLHTRAFRAVVSRAHAVRVRTMPPTPAPTPTPTPTGGVGTQLLALVNEARATARTCGATRYPAARPLAASAALDRAAGDYATLMATEDFFSHEGPDGSTMVSRINAVGIRDVAMRENIAAGQSSASSVMQAWLDSPGHCANLMGADVTRVGFGFATGGSYGRYWVEDFAG